MLSQQIFVCQLWHPHQESGEKWLAFHYHHGDTEEDFVWVRLVGKATIFLTLCIQSAVNELIRVSQYYHGLGGHFVCYVYSHTPNIY